MKIKDPRKGIKCKYKPEIDTSLSGRTLKDLAESGMTLGEFKKRYGISR